MINEVHVILEPAFFKDWAIASKREKNAEIDRLIKRMLPDFIESGNWKVKFVEQ